MSKNKKLLAKIYSNSKNFKFAELEKLLASLGYTLKEGKGSRVRFIHERLPLILLHKPHPGNIVDVNAVNDIVEVLKENGIKP